MWAQLLLSATDSGRLHDFFCTQCGLKPRSVAGHMHLTVYYARRRLPGVIPSTEPSSVVVDARDTRLMIVAPGGENPRPELDPARRTIGLRIQRRSPARVAILEYRARLLQFETRQVLKGRTASTHVRNAFGARHFQPHMTLLKPGSGVDGSLTSLGERFRASVGTLTFDRFLVDVVRRTVESKGRTP